MKKSEKKLIFILLVVTAFIVVALLFHYIARNYFASRSFFFDKLLNFTSTFIYIGLISGWVVTINKRIVQPKIRKTLIATAAVMIIWLIMREFKYRFINNPDALRYLWYLYYIPLLLIPLLALFNSLYIDKFDDYKLPKAVILLLIPFAALAALVITNDLHQLVFRFPPDSAVWSEYDFKYAPAYFAVIIWEIACSLAAFVIMITKAANHKKSRLRWMPLIPVAAAIGYTAMYAADIPIIGFINDVPAFFCLVYISFFELCVQSGLIQSNIGYSELLKASKELSLQIADKDFNIIYSPAGIEKYSKEQMISAAEAPVITDSGMRLQSIEIDGGYALWAEDISEIAEIRRQLLSRREELVERNSFLTHEFEREKEFKIFEEKNRLYDLLQSKTQLQIDKIDNLVHKYQLADNSEDKKRILSKIIVLGSFLKRRKNFVLSIEPMKSISADMLRAALDESFRSMKLLNIKGGYLVSIEGGSAYGEILSSAYDFFEDIMEAVIDDAKYFNVTVSTIGGCIRESVLTDYTGATAIITAKYPSADIIREDDGTRFIMNFSGGDENA